MFNSLGFAVGLSALILGYSSQIEMGNFMMNSGFLLGVIGFYFFICNNDSVGLIDSLVAIAAWVLYVTVKWLQQKKEKKCKLPHMLRSQSSQRHRVDRDADSNQQKGR
jgi:hypothetical protein